VQEKQGNAFEQEMLTGAEVGNPHRATIICRKHTDRLGRRLRPLAKAVDVRDL